MHQDLLSLARHLVDRNPGVPIQADLRRAVSTAYYAFFHLLISETVTRYIVGVDFQARVGRSFVHGRMKDLCKSYVNKQTNKVGQAVPPQVNKIASDFVALQTARHRADYNLGDTVTYIQADTEVMRAEDFFLDWAAIQADPAALTFLQDLFCKCIIDHPE